MAIESARTIVSGLSQPVGCRGQVYAVEIFREASEPRWSLAINGPGGGRRLWRSEFDDDVLALIAAQKAIWRPEGAMRPV